MKIAIFGTSGFALEVASIARALGYNSILFIAKNEPDQTLEEAQIRESNLHQILSYDFAIGVSNGYIREQIYHRHKNLTYPNLIHPSANITDDFKYSLESKKGINISAGVTFTPKVTMSNFSVVHMNASIGHETQIAEYGSVMPGANVSGNVCLGRYVYVGSGAVILPGTRLSPMRIGDGATVGAGAVVLADVDAGATVVGVPAHRIN